jgi:hypothetical protein
MVKVIELPDNLIGQDDQKFLEAFGGHEISHGRATRFHWQEDKAGNPSFEIYRGGENEVLVLCIHRDREKDLFEAVDATGDVIASGALDHVMAVLDKKLADEHKDYTPYTPA